MCPRPAPGQQFTCSKNIFQFTWPKKDAEKKVEKTWSQNKADKTNKLPVLKF